MTKFAQPIECLGLALGLEAAALDSCLGQSPVESADQQGSIHGCHEECTLLTSKPRFFFFLFLIQKTKSFIPLIPDLFLASYLIAHGYIRTVWYDFECPGAFSPPSKFSQPLAHSTWTYSFVHALEIRQ